MLIRTTIEADFFLSKRTSIKQASKKTAKESNQAD